MWLTSSSMFRRMALLRMNSNAAHLVECQSDTRRCLPFRKRTVRTLWSFFRTLLRSVPVNGGLLKTTMLAHAVLWLIAGISLPFKERSAADHAASLSSLNGLGLFCFWLLLRSIWARRPVSPWGPTQPNVCTTLGVMDW